MGRADVWDAEAGDGVGDGPGDGACTSGEGCGFGAGGFSVFTGETRGKDLAGLSFLGVIALDGTRGGFVGVLEPLVWPRMKAARDVGTFFCVTARPRMGNGTSGFLYVRGIIAFLLSLWIADG